MSRIIQCSNGHFYDAEKSSECPYCREQQKLGNSLGDAPVFTVDRQGMEDQPTVPLMPPSEPDSVFLRDRTGSEAGLGSDPEMTVAVQPGLGVRRSGGLVTGWLVGISGPVRGRDYRIFHGMNWIGRDYSSDIIIGESMKVSRIRHCSIVYDGRSNRFFAAPGSGTNTYLNGEPLTVPSPLREGSILEIGECRFEFVPYCREGHTWATVENV